mmetsp:Transcript_10465/g.28506  ORF Transcript_10465/g.28506 Transcript_10465/m.28506 type:complete len:267 (-) Transcript_10465:96-896(-)|eukprot:CAMPEP_0185189424 /NCGR_PEP_ID=MMETSP1140-20130426/6028_1 /TAXON_ID=298111 /ORGANISM="Pavlova sp., Strain CCMP459" /LENGTH=266 /DNA_ID=CAMNT_0027755985 /DNA_START=307 /DNA_END=1107 /DNA_ORIENTATION=-
MSWRSVSAACSEGDGLVLVHAPRQLPLLLARVDHLHLALELAALAEDDGALHLELGAGDEGGRALAHELFKVVHFLIAVVQRHERRAVPRGLEGQGPVLSQLVAVRPEGQQVRAALHGREALARHHQGGRVRAKALDGCAHGGLELQHRRRLLVARVHRLLVADEGEREEAPALCELRLERLEVNPEVVGVEVAVPGDVLEGGRVLVRALGALAQQQATPGCGAGEVPALLVRGRAVRHLHEEGGAALGEVREDARVQRGSEVVRV